jgi:hypothetical protein
VGNEILGDATLPAGGSAVALGEAHLCSPTCQSPSITPNWAMESRNRAQETQRKTLEESAALTDGEGGWPPTSHVQDPASVLFAFFCGKSHFRF